MEAAVAAAVAGHSTTVDGSSELATRAEWQPGSSPRQSAAVPPVNLPDSNGTNPMFASYARRGRQTCGSEKSTRTRVEDVDSERVDEEEPTRVDLHTLRVDLATRQAAMSDQVQQLTEAVQAVPRIEERVEQVAEALAQLATSLNKLHVGQQRSGQRGSAVIGGQFRAP